MRKTFVIARRDYLAAVKTKSFLISLILMPVLMGGGIVISRFSEHIGDTRPKHVAVIDRTVPVDVRGMPAEAPERRSLGQVLMDKAVERNEQLHEDAGDGRLRAAPYVFEPAWPGDDSPEALDQLRFELSERVRHGELFAFIEIGPRVLGRPPEELQGSLEALGGLLADRHSPTGEEAGPDAIDPDEAAAIFEAWGIRYSSQNQTYLSLRQWIAQTLTPVIYERRLEREGLGPGVLELIIPPVVTARALAIQDEHRNIVYAREPNPIIGFAIPLFMVFLLFTVVMAAASPLATNIVEEKQLRIAEVLLGAVRPFELMLGKLLGGVGVSLTLSGIYLAGGLFVAREFGVLEEIEAATLGWFLVFVVLGTLMYGSLFVAAGAAVSNLKEAQNIITPIILLVVAPIFVMMNVMENPDGPVAQASTWFPLTTPVAATLRLGVPPGLAREECIAAALLALATTLALVWLAGRVFRFGMLHHDKAAAFGDVVRWVTRG